MDCGDGNRTMYYDSLLAGTYFIPVLMDPFNSAEGPYEITVAADACGISTGILQSEEENWLVYPNPNRGLINVMSRTTGIYNIELIDLKGSLVYQDQLTLTAGQAIELDLQDVLITGNYIFEVEQQHRSFRSEDHRGVAPIRTFRKGA